ncbi:MAG: hypothetical protein O7D27_03320 [Alphaproteobacteria bacterium]|nr:hypothetical protein [Alphaproteobacteria bacterium]MCZ6849671.1 hypothetical protein [Alphaproteobacteria bacterium]
MSLLQTLLKPDHDEHPERTEVARAANLLQIGEFQLLQLAYHDWHGEDVGPEDINRLFRSYMLESVVPHWARHYARRIMALDADGILDDREPHYHRYDVNVRTNISHGVRQFCLVVVVVTICIGGALWISYLATGGNTALLPPYFEEHELKPQR